MLTYALFSGILLGEQTEFTEVITVKKYNVAVVGATGMVGRTFLKVLEEINAMGTTIVMATHDKDIVNRMQKRVVYLDHGRLASDNEKGG